MMEQLGSAAAPGALRPSTAFRVAQILDASSNGRVARGYYEVAAQLDTLSGRRALVRALELGPAPDAATLASAADRVNGQPELERRVKFLLRTAVLAGARGAINEPPGEPTEIHPPLDVRSAPMRRAPPRLVPVRLIGPEEGQFRVLSANGINLLPLKRILGLAVGLVPSAPGGRMTVLTDLLIEWGDMAQGPTVLRARQATWPSTRCFLTCRQGGLPAAPIGDFPGLGGYAAPSRPACRDLPSLREPRADDKELLRSALPSDARSFTIFNRVQELRDCDGAEQYRGCIRAV